MMVKVENSLNGLSRVSKDQRIAVMDIEPKGLELEPWGRKYELATGCLQPLH